MKKSLLFCIGIVLFFSTCEEAVVEIVNEPPRSPFAVFPLNEDTVVTAAVQFEWYSTDKEGDEILYDFYVGSDETPSLVQADLSTPTFEWQVPSTGTYYWYIVASDGQNEVKGNTYSTHVIRPEDLPSMGTTRLVDLGKGYASVASTSDVSDEILARGFVWGLKPNPTKADNILQIEGTDPEFSAVLEELYIRTPYFVRAYATVEAGTIYSEELQFTAWDDGIDQGTFIDLRDERQYEFKRIGNQKWMTSNLAYLPRVDPPLKGSNTRPYYYVYYYFGKDLDSAKLTDNYKTYGVLYNWSAALGDGDRSKKKIQGVCPDDYHLPNEEEWNILVDFLGGRGEGGGKLKETGSEHWVLPNTGATDEFGFRGLPAGSRGPAPNAFQGMGARAFFWSAGEESESYAKRRYLYREFNAVGEYFHFKSMGFSVRCLQD